MMKKIILFFVISAAVSLSSCTGNGSVAGRVGGDTVSFKYARHITVVKYKGYSVVSLVDPWKQGKVLHAYVLVPREAPLPPSLPEGTVVRTPLTRSVVFTTAHCQLLEYLGKAWQIKGVADLKYILIPDIQRRVRQKKIADCGESMSPVIERIIDLKPDGIILSPFENSGGYGRLENIGVPLIEAADYMETSALGRAEWMRFYGMLYGCETRADSLFRVVDSTYTALKRAADKLPVGRSILTERKTGSVWYCPAGGSTIGQMIRDANGRYAFSHDRRSGSLALSFELVLDKAGDCDVWAFKFNGEKPMSKADLLAEFRGYNELRAFKTGNIYQCNASKRPYFEEVPFRPDYFLRDMILLLHPDRKQFGSLRYYERY